MLGFFKRYQRVFIGLLVAILCTSFLFFGIFPKGGNGFEDPVAFKLSNGKKVKRSHLEGIKALMETNNGESLIFGRALGAHFFTENFIVSDLMKPGILSLLVDRYENEFKEDLTQHLKREKAFTPYFHPNANFLNAESIWSIHAPKLKEELYRLHQETDAKKAFNIRQNLYLQEESFDPFALWQVLKEQEAQLSWLPKDQDLTPEKLHLFGYQSTREWLGEALMDKATKLVLEVNHFAKSQGCVISMQDAQNDLLKLNEVNFQRLRALGIKEFETKEHYFQEKCKRLGLTAHQMVSLWRELLVFRRFLNESAQSLLLDQTTFQAFEQHASEKVHVATYSLPKELQFENKDQWMQFEAYLQALGKPIDQLSLKFKKRPTQEIAKRYPSLVEDRFHLAFQEVSLQECLLNVQQKEVWQFKLNKDNQPLLKKQFPSLAFREGMSQKELQELFESLDPKMNYLVDQFVKETLVKVSDTWYESAFKEAKLIEGDFLVRKNGQGLPFFGLESYEGKSLWLSQLIDLAENFDEDRLKVFTFDQKHYYKLKQAQLIEKDRLVAFSTLRQDRSLEKLLYLTLKDFKKEEFHLDQKLSRAKQVAAEEWLAPLKKAISHDYLSLHKELPSPLDDTFYLQYRLYAPMREALAFLKDHTKAKEICSLNDLWNLYYQEQTWVRYLDEEDKIAPLLSHKVGQWTEVVSSKDGLEFSHVLSKPKEAKSFLTQRHLKKKIGDELKRVLITSVLDNPSLNR